MTVYLVLDDPAYIFVPKQCVSEMSAVDFSGYVPGLKILRSRENLCVNEIFYLLVFSIHLHSGFHCAPRQLNA